MSGLLRIKSVGEEKTASDGRKYKTIGFQEVDSMFNGEAVLSNEPIRFRNLWNLGPPSAAGETDFSAGDPLYEKVTEGVLVKGSIHTRTVEAYTIPASETSPAREVNMYTIVKFSHENVITQFARQKHNLVNEETGEVINQRTIIASKPAAEEAEKVETPEEAKEEY